ncbi:calponin homology domain-containing protein DDB_G0272472-like isoform X2 [Myxocyprinus asiaticus]|uniref:calponin homology domain-containing protein DDB_G0272472-like isoform X2 n=1 Tax=Myxocyprinus asiaticus TaxID=70543 RepID=UPI002222A593|nr:calponin homology domain-containing protein DDB_G0272472-like isoform X2 [Myxocyprinus asiaticus]
MAAQVEVDARRSSVVGGRLHLSPLIDSSNKSLLEASGGPQGTLIIPSEPCKPIPGPKPRLTPKPFAVEKNPTIRPILAPKPQPKPRSESTRPASYKPDPPSTSKPQPPGKPITNQNRPASTAFKTSPKPSTGQTNKPVAQSFKTASTIASKDSNKSTTSQTRDVLRRTSFGVTPARPRIDVHASTPGVEWPFASRNKQLGTSITRAKSTGFLAEVGLNYEDSKEDTGAKEDSSPTVFRPQSKGLKPRPVSAVFLSNPSQSEPQVETPSPAPRWAERRPLSSDLTSKFASIGLSLHRRPAKEDSKENTTETPEGVGAVTQREKENGAEKAEGLNKPPEKMSQKMESNDEDSKPEDKGGGSIKRRISLLLDSSSLPFSVAHVDTQVTEPRSPLLSVSDTDGAVGVKQRIKELTEEIPTTPSPPQKPQFKPHNLVPDRIIRVEVEHDSLISSESKDSEEVEDDLSKKFEGQFNKQEDWKTSSLGVKDLPAHSTFDRVQTVRAAMFEHVVERHSVQVMEDSASQGRGTQQESTVKPMPRRNHYLDIRDNTFKALEVSDPGSLVKATYRGQFSPSSPVRVEHVFDTVALFGESRAVSEILPTAQLEDRALTLRSQRSAPKGEVNSPSPKMINLIKDEESTSAASPMEPGIPCYLRVGALQKWTVTEVDQEKEAERERQREMVRKMEEEIQRQMELHMSAAAALEEEEEESEAELKKQIEAQRERERELEDGAAPKRPKMLDSEEQMNKPRATYFALTGQIQEPVHQSERLDEAVIFERGKRRIMDGEDRRIKELPFDEFSVSTRQWSPQDPIAPFKRNPSLDAAMQSDLQEELHINDTGQRIDHRLQEREQKKAIREEMEIVRQRLEDEKMKELERQCEMKKQRDLEIKKQKEIEREKRKEMEILKERQKQLERQRDQERERQRELERQREIERQKQREKEQQKQIEYERIKSAEKELEKQREFERQRQKEFEREKERMLDQERLRLREFEKQKEMEKERERVLELERQREVERQKQRELERQREMERQKELERQRKLERQRELEKQKDLEKERQRLLERQRELDGQRELERQRDLERQQEIERQRELDKQKELERQKQRELEIERWNRQKLEKRENRREQEELERIKELERRQLLDFELHRQRERQIQQEQAKRGKNKKEPEEERHQQPERERGAERQQMEAEQEKRTPTSPLRPKVLDLDAVSLGVWTGRDSHKNSPTARWKQPSLHIDEPYKPAILDIDLFMSQTQPDTFPLTGFGGLESGGVGSMMQVRSHAIQQNRLQPHPAPQAQSSSPGERVRTQLPPPLQPQILHHAQPHSLPLATQKSKPQTHSLIETSDFAFGARQPSSALTHTQTDVWRQTQVELAVDEPLWVSAIEGSRRPISTRPSNFEQQLLQQEERGTILTSNATSTTSLIFTPVQNPSLAPPMVPIQNPTLVVPPSLGPPVALILTSERGWTSLPFSGESSVGLFPSPETPLAKKESSVPSSQVATSSVTDSIWSPNWELASQGQRENRAPHSDKGQQKLRSRSMCRRSAPTESSADAPLVHELVKQCVSGHEENKDTDNLVQETDSQYGTWETGLRTDDSLTPATPPSECNLTPIPQKPTPLHTSEQPLLIDTPDGSTPCPHEQMDLAPFPEMPTTLLDSSALRSRVQLNKKTRRALPSRAARHSALLSQVPEGSGVGTDKWRCRDSTVEKADSFKQEEESDSEEQAKGTENSTSSIYSQPQRVALFPGMDPSVLKAQLKKRGESDNQTDNPSPSQSSRAPKSPFLPRAARVLPPAGGKENREESSPQWLQELKTKKRLSQYETDSTA